MYTPSFTSANLRESELGTFGRAGNGVEELGDVPWIRIGIVVRGYQERSWPRAHACARRDVEAFGMHVVERDVDPAEVRSARHPDVESKTARHGPCNPDKLRSEFRRQLEYKAFRQRKHLGVTGWPSIARVRFGAAQLPLTGAVGARRLGHGFGVGVRRRLRGTRSCGVCR